MRAKKMKSNESQWILWNIIARGNLFPSENQSMSVDANKQNNATNMYKFIFQRSALNSNNNIRLDKNRDFQFSLLCTTRVNKKTLICYRNFRLKYEILNYFLQILNTEHRTHACYVVQLWPSCLMSHHHVVSLCLVTPNSSGWGSSMNKFACTSQR